MIGLTLAAFLAAPFVPPVVLSHGQTIVVTCPGEMEAVAMRGPISGVLPAGMTESILTCLNPKVVQ